MAANAKGETTGCCGGCEFKACVAPTNCVGTFGAYGACSKTCGAGTQTASYKISTAAANGGAACAAADTATRSRACTVKACPGQVYFIGIPAVHSFP